MAVVALLYSSAFLADSTRNKKRDPFPKCIVSDPYFFLYMYYRLKNSAYARLALHPDGDKWREEIIQRTREAIENSNGGTDSIEEITLDELSETISNHGVKGIPASIREEILSKIKVAYSSFDQRR